MFTCINTDKKVTTRPSTDKLNFDHSLIFILSNYDPHNINLDFI